MDLKSVTLTGLKVAGDPGADLEEGQFLAYASTWTKEPDSYGDIVKKGAFTDTLKEWKDSGNTLPILFGHRMDDPDYWIGGAVDAREDDHGLLIKGALDLEAPKAKQVYRLLKGRRINQMSFAFDTLEDGMVDLGNEKAVHELRKLKLYEVSVVPIGANQDTEVLAVKALVESVKSGRVISTKNLDSLKSARDAISAVIASAESTDSDTETNSGKSRTLEGQEAKSDAARHQSALASTVAFIASL